MQFVLYTSASSARYQDLKNDMPTLSRQTPTNYARDGNSPQTMVKELQSYLLLLKGEMEKKEKPCNQNEPPHKYCQQMIPTGIT